MCLQGNNLTVIPTGKNIGRNSYLKKLIQDTHIRITKNNLDVIIISGSTQLSDNQISCNTTTIDA